MLWVVALGRFDISTATMTIGRFRAAPRQGHLDRLKCVYGGLRKFPHGSIHIRTNEPNYNNLPKSDHSWLYSIYGNCSEDIPKDIPTPLGKPVILSTYLDANLYHDYITGRSVTGILQLVNSIPIDWLSKHLATVEMATYGSEFVAACQATDKSIDL